MIILCAALLLIAIQFAIRKQITAKRQRREKEILILCEGVGRNLDLEALDLDEAQRNEVVKVVQNEGVRIVLDGQLKHMKSLIREAPNFRALIALLLLIYKFSNMRTALRDVQRRVNHEQDNRPPLRAEYLLYLFLPKKERECLPGDLEEEYRMMRAKYGLFWAKAWYWYQVLASLWPLVLRFAKTIGKVWLLRLGGEWAAQIIHRFIH